MSTFSQFYQLLKQPRSLTILVLLLFTPIALNYSLQSCPPYYDNYYWSAPKEIQYAVRMMENTIRVAAHVVMSFAFILSILLIAVGISFLYIRKESIWFFLYALALTLTSVLGGVISLTTHCDTIGAKLSLNAGFFLFEKILLLVPAYAFAGAGISFTLAMYYAIKKWKEYGWRRHKSAIFLLSSLLLMILAFLLAHTDVISSFMKYGSVLE